MSERTLRERARRLGFEISKGYQRYLRGGEIVRDSENRPITGYNVLYVSLGCLAWDCYDNICDHLMDFHDVVQFLQEADTDNVFAW